MGTVGTLEEHIATCYYVLLPCPNECKNEKDNVQHFMRKDLDDHLEDKCPNQDYTCNHCDLAGTYVFITTEHDEVCPEKIIPCPNKECDEVMEHRHIEEHVEDVCDYTKIPCKYKNIGCDMVCIRRDMEAHEEDDKLHLHMAIDTTAKLSNIIAVLQEEKPTPFTFKLKWFHRLKDEEDCAESPDFYTSIKGYCMSIRVYPAGYGDGYGTHVHVC